MSVIFVFLPKPQSASALCDIMEVLSYFRQQKGFVAGWVLLKQLHGVWGSLETGTQEGKEAGLGRRRVWKDLTQSGGKLCSEYIQSQCPALGKNYWASVSRLGLSQVLQKGHDLREACLWPWGGPWRSGQLKALCWPCSQNWAARPSPKRDLGSLPPSTTVPHVNSHLSRTVVLGDRHNHFRFIDEETEARAFSAISLA